MCNLPRLRSSRTAYYARWLTFPLLALTLWSCVSIPPLPPLPQGAPPDFPSAFYRQAAKQRSRVDRIDPSRSLITIYAYRSGPLAAAGHDHVVASHDAQGYILVSKDQTKSRADLYIPVATLRVDEQALRAEAGFTTKPSAQDKENTRRNMLHSVLEAPDFPYVRMHIEGLQEKPPGVTLNAQLTLHGNTRNISIPAELRSDSKNMEVSGEFRIRQTVFGITPYSILGGALAVKDQLRISFHIYGANTPR
jgi:polyisoprenoid-binding protein YceI